MFHIVTVTLSAVVVFSPVPFVTISIVIWPLFTAGRSLFFARNFWPASIFGFAFSSSIWFIPLISHYIGSSISIRMVASQPTSVMAFETIAHHLGY